MLVLFILTLLAVCLMALFLTFIGHGRKAGLFLVVMAPTICAIFFSWNILIKYKIPYRQKFTEILLAMGWTPWDFYNEIFVFPMGMREAKSEYGMDVTHRFKGAYEVGVRIPVAKPTDWPDHFVGIVELEFMKNGKSVFVLNNLQAPENKITIKCRKDQCIANEILMRYAVPKHVPYAEPVLIRVRTKKADVAYLQKYKTTLFVRKSKDR